ncbi:MAG TPA: hypothetical protein VF533_15595 [Solirubrobacteraceae bacterium]|jgi:hypothetical protein
MPLLNTLIRLARSPQGRRMAAKAARYAQSPEGKRKIAQTRERVAARRTKRVR